MEQSSNGTSVIRQETFDVDPSLTLRSRSGGIKHGTIAVPVIDTVSISRTPPIKENSLEVELGNNRQNYPENRSIENNRPSTYKLQSEEKLASDKEKDIYSNQAHIKTLPKKSDGKSVNTKHVDSSIKKSSEEKKSWQTANRSAEEKSSENSNSQQATNRNIKANILEENQSRQKPNRNVETKTSTDSRIRQTVNRNVDEKALEDTRSQQAASRNVNATTREKDKSRQKTNRNVEVNTTKESQVRQIANGNVDVKQSDNILDRSSEKNQTGSKNKNETSLEDKSTKFRSDKKTSKNPDKETGKVKKNTKNSSLVESTKETKNHDSTEEKDNSSNKQPSEKTVSKGIEITHSENSKVDPQKNKQTKNGKKNVDEKDRKNENSATDPRSTEKEPVKTATRLTNEKHLPNKSSSQAIVNNTKEKSENQSNVNVLTNTPPIKKNESKPVQNNSHTIKSKPGKEKVVNNNTKHSGGSLPINSSNPKTAIVKSDVTQDTNSRRESKELNAITQPSKSLQPRDDHIKPPGEQILDKSDLEGEDTASVDLFPVDVSDVNNSPPNSTTLDNSYSRSDYRTVSDPSVSDKSVKVIVTSAESDKNGEAISQLVDTFGNKHDTNNAEKGTLNKVNISKSNYKSDNNSKSASFDKVEEKVEESIHDNTSNSGFTKQTNKSRYPLKQSEVQNIKSTANPFRVISPTVSYRSDHSEGINTKTNNEYHPRGFKTRSASVRESQSSRLSLSSEKHFHGQSRVYSPEKPTYDNPNSSIMNSTSDSKIHMESYENVFAERQTLLNAEITYKKRIKQLEDELNQFLRTIDDLRVENKGLRAQIDVVDTSSSNNIPVSHQSKNTVVIDTEKNALEARIQDLQKENKELNEKLGESNTKVKLAESENKRLLDEIQDACAKNKELTAKCSDMENILSKNEDNKESAKDTENDELQRIMTENASLAVDVEKLNSDIKQKDEAAKTSLNEIEKLQKELEASKYDEERAKSQFEKLKLEYEQIKQEGDESKNKEIEKLKSEVVKLKMELKRTEAEKEKYRELTTPRAEASQGKKSPSSETMSLKSQVISLQTENQKLNEDIFKMKAEHLETVKKMHDLEKSAQSFEKSVTAVESEKITEIQELKNENERLKGEIKELSESVIQKKSEISELMSAIKGDNLEDEVKSLKEDKAKLEKEFEQKGREVEQLKANLEEVKIESDKLESEKSAAQANNDKTKIDLEKLSQQLEEMKKELAIEKETSASLSGAEKDVATARDQVGKLEKDLENLKIKYDREVQNIKEVSEKENEEWRKKYMALEKDHQLETSQLKAEIERLKSEVNKLEGLRTAARDLEETKNELVTLHGRVSELTIELEQRSSVEERNFEMSLKIDTLKKRIRELEQSNKDIDVEKDKLEDFEASNKRLSTENKRLRDLLDSKGVDTKIEILERKQIDAETRVKQLEGWVGGLYEEKPQTYSSMLKQKKQNFSKAVPVVADKSTSKKPRSLEDVKVKVEDDKMTHSSTPSLPNIPEKNHLTFGLGYTQLHRRRLNVASKVRKS